MKIKIRQIIVPSQPIEEEIRVNGSTIGDVIDALVSKYGKNFKEYVLNPKNGQLQHGVILTLNGQDVRRLKGLKTKIKDDDMVSFLLPISGG